MDAGAKYKKKPKKYLDFVTNFHFKLQDGGVPNLENYKGGILDRGPKRQTTNKLSRKEPQFPKKSIS